VGSEFQVDAGGRAQRVVVACSGWRSYRQPRPVWTFDERHVFETSLTISRVFSKIEFFAYTGTRSPSARRLAEHEYSPRAPSVRPRYAHRSLPHRRQARMACSASIHGRLVI